jgi:hypothetical protein
MVTSHEIAHHDHRKANGDCLLWGRDSKTQIKSFNEYERRKELNSGAVGRGLLLRQEKSLSAIKGPATMPL